MSIPIPNKEDVVYNKEEDPINKEIGLSESVNEEDNKIEENEPLGTIVSSEEGIDDIRIKIVNFMKSQGYSYAEGEREFDDEISDIFAKGSTLVEIAITVGIDEEVIKQLMKEEN